MKPQETLDGTLNEIQRLYREFKKIGFSAQPSIKIARAKRQGLKKALIDRIPALAAETASLRTEREGLRRALTNLVEADLACRDDGGMEPAQWYLKCRRDAEELLEKVKG